MSKRSKSKIYDKRPTTFHYVKQVIRYGFTLTSFREIVYLFFYYIINHVKGISTVHLGKGVRIWPTALLRDAERIYIGEGSSINHNNILWAGRKSAVIQIGKNVMLGPNVTILAYNHYIEDRVVLPEHFSEEDIVIGDNVWIGAGVTILAGAKIGDGSVVGAGAVVVGELPSHSVCVGIPAKPVKQIK
jgi:acetyltransferase-like isoleucine patch superfamily enzyme